MKQKKKRTLGPIWVKAESLLTFEVPQKDADCL
jgi:hypothetical protein